MFKDASFKSQGVSIAGCFRSCYSLSQRNNFRYINLTHFNLVSAFEWQKRFNLSFRELFIIKFPNFYRESGVCIPCSIFIAIIKCIRINERDTDQNCLLLVFIQKHQKRELSNNRLLQLKRLQAILKDELHILFRVQAAIR